jgi:hypothetical protein
MTMKSTASTPASRAAPAEAPGKGHSLRWAGLCLLCLGAVVGALFSQSFQASQVHFSSDGPLGANMAKWADISAGYTGMWQDLYWLGGRGGSAYPSFTHALLMVIGPVGFAKFYPPLCLLVLGLSVWLCFRQLGFRPGVCILGALAATLNTDFLSYACWGLGTLPLAVAALFLGLAALATPASNRAWLKTALAGLAVGLAVMEGFDSGAILSLYFAAFVIFQAVQGAAASPRRWLVGLGRAALAAGMAAFIAAQALTVLIGTQIKGVVGMQQDQHTKAQRWDEATMWSLPKVETLRVVIPGLFGYRMDTPDGGNYWGAVGQKPGVIQSRHSGSGVYGGVLMVVVAFWAVLQSRRKKDCPFTPPERRTVWFWAIALVISLLLAWGRHAPFYQFVYALPYFSTIRNPIKFMHPFHVALVMLFGYGLQCLWRCYLGKAVVAVGALPDRLKAWWAAAPGFDKRWSQSLVVAVCASLVGWLIYAASYKDLVAFLKVAAPPPELAPAIAKFSLLEVGWFILLLGVTALIFILILSGVLAGVRARWGMAVLSLLVVADLARASAPWIYYWNYPEKYATNPVLDILRARPYEQRVAMFPFQVNEYLEQFRVFYQQEWLQHQFPYYNIQSLDVAQEPRPAVENVAFRMNLLTKGGPGYVRLLELTGTRFVFGLAGGFLDALNQQLDPARKRFRPHTLFTLEQAKADAAVVTRTNASGPFALIEFTGALPRAKLFAHWQVVTNDNDALSTLAATNFNPAQTVLVSSPLPGPAPAPSATNQAGGAVEYVSYAPKDIQLKATAARPSVLLLNDKHDPAWTVTVDGQPAPLLRCNYLMRGVYLPAGQHQVRFTFRLPTGALAVSLAALGVGVCLLGWLWSDARKLRPAASAQAP